MPVLFVEVSKNHHASEKCPKYVVLEVSYYSTDEFLFTPCVFCLVCTSETLCALVWVPWAGCPPGGGGSFTEHGNFSIILSSLIPRREPALTTNLYPCFPPPPRFMPFVGLYLRICFPNLCLAEMEVPFVQLAVTFWSGILTVFKFFSVIFMFIVFSSF